MTGRVRVIQATLGELADKARELSKRRATLMASFEYADMSKVLCDLVDGDERGAELEEISSQLKANGAEANELMRELKTIEAAESVRQEAKREWRAYWAKYGKWANRFCFEVDRLALSTRARRCVCHSVTYAESSIFFKDERPMEFHEWISFVRAKPAMLRRLPGVGKATSAEILKAINAYTASRKPAMPYSVEYGYA